MAARLQALPHPPLFTPQKHYFFVSGAHFCLRPSNPQGLGRPEGLNKLKNSFISSGLELATFRLIASASTTTLPRDPVFGVRRSKNYRGRSCNVMWKCYLGIGTEVNNESSREYNL
jgi:hypothetical protein